MKSITITSETMIRRYCYILLLPLLFVTSCRNAKRCKGEDINKGIIIESVNISCSLNQSGDFFHLATDSAFQNAFITDDPSSDNCPPSVDFSKEDLLGFEVDGACEVKFVREVTEDLTNMKYIYEVEVEECGFCKSLTSSYNWVTVPKLPEGWTVEFKKVSK